MKPYCLQCVLLSDIKLCFKRLWSFQELLKCAMHTDLLKVIADHKSKAMQII